MISSRFVLVTILVAMIAIHQPSLVSAYPFDAEYTTPDNSVQGFDEYSEGRYILLDGMATWCQPCRVEMLHLQDVYKTIKDNENVDMITMSMDPETDTIDKLGDFMENFDASWDYGLDHTQELADAFNVTGYPTTYFLDPEGKVLKKWLGLTEADEILDVMDNYLDLPGSVVRELQLDDLLSNLFSNVFFYLFMIMTWMFIFYSGYKFIDRLKAPQNQTSE